MTGTIEAASRAADPEPAGRRGWMGAAFEGVFYLVAALALAWPVTFHLGSRAIGGGDSESYIWFGWRVGELLRSGELLPTVIPDVIVPHGIDLLRSDGYLPTYVMGIWNVLTGPILAYNLTILTATLLNLWAGRTLARCFTGDRLAGALVAVAFATAPAIALRAYGHPTMYFAFTGPLLVAEGVRVARGDIAVRPGRVAVLLALAYLNSVFFLVFGGLAYAVIVLVGAGRRFPRLVPRLAIAAVIAAVLISPFIVARLRLESAERDAGAKVLRDTDTYTYSSDLTGIVVQPSTATVELPGMDSLRGGFSQDNVLEATVFPGFLLLSGLGALVLFRSRARAPLLAAAATVWVMTLGPTLIVGRHVVVLDAAGAAARWLPFTALQAVPGLASLRTPNRASFTLAAVLAAGFAIGIGWLFERIGTAGRIATAAACALLLVPSLVLPLPWATLDLSPTSEAALRQIRARARPGDTLALVPADCADGLNRDVKLQIVHQLPVIGCQGNFSAIAWYSELDDYARSAALASLRCDPSEVGRRETRFRDRTQPEFDAERIQQMRKQFGTRFYLVDKYFVGPECSPSVAAVEFLRSNAKLLGEDARWIVFDAGRQNPTSSSPSSR